MATACVPERSSSRRATDTWKCAGRAITRAKRSLYLGAHENVVTAMRKIYFEAMDNVAAGTDPKHILRDEAGNSMVSIRGAELGELV